MGGGYQNIGGQSHNNLAAVEAATGKVTNFNPAGLGTDCHVFALEGSGTQVYVGGQFEKLGSQTRKRLAKIAGTMGGDLGWIPNPTLGGGGGLAPVRAYIEELLPDILEGCIQPGRVFGRTVDLDGVPEGCRVLADRASIKVMVQP